MKIPAFHRQARVYSALRPRDDQHPDSGRSSSEYEDVNSQQDRHSGTYHSDCNRSSPRDGATSDCDLGMAESDDILAMTKRKQGVGHMQGTLVDGCRLSHTSHAQRPQTTFGCVSQYITNLQERTWNNGITCMHVSGLIFSLATLCVKLVGGRIPAFEIVLARCSLSLFVNVSVATSFKLSPMWGQRKHWFLLGLRGLLGMASMTTMYFAVSNLPMPDAVTIVFTNPAVTALLAWVMLREQFGWRAAVGCVLSLVGVALVARPPFLFGSAGEAYGAQQVFGVIMAVVSSACTALSFIVVRVIGQKEPSLVFALWQHAMSFATSAIPLALGWPDVAVTPSLKDSTLLAGVGFLSFISQVLTNRAFQLEPAGKVASINLMQVLYSYLFELCFFHANITLLSTAGSFLVACGVVVVNTRGCCLKSSRATTDEQECLTQALLPNGMHNESCHMHEGFMTQPLAMSRGDSHASLGFPQLLSEGMGALDGPAVVCINTCNDEPQVSMARNRALSSSVLAALMENTEAAALAPATPCCLGPHLAGMGPPAPSLPGVVHFTQPPPVLTTNWAPEGEFMTHLTNPLTHPSEGLALLETVFDHAGQKLRRELDAIQEDPNVNPWLPPFLKTLIHKVDTNQQVAREWRSSGSSAIGQPVGQAAVEVADQYEPATTESMESPAGEEDVAARKVDSPDAMLPTMQ